MDSSDNSVEEEKQVPKSRGTRKKVTRKGKDECVSPPNPMYRCIFMLENAQSDTDKFAALLMVTKLIKAEELTETTKRALINAIGLGSLTRMLRTDEAPEGCPPHLFKSIALTILSCFVSTCAGNSALYGILPSLAEIVQHPDAYEDDLTLIKDAYICLTGIAQDSGGRKAIINFEVVGQLVDTYIAEGYYHEEALKVLQCVILGEGSGIWVDEPEAFTKLIKHVADDFSREQGEQKFALCALLADILPSLPSCVNVTEATWSSSLHSGLSDIIFSKLGREMRNQGLRLAGVTLENLGASWVVMGGDRGQQLLLMMVHLACIEVRMSLEDKSLQEAVALASPTTACYSILENAINYMISNESLELEQKQKQQLYAALKGAFHAVLSFLKDVSSDESYTNKPKTQLFVCATIRVLGAWLAEETSANKEEVYSVLPFLFHAAKYNFEWNKVKPTKMKKKNLGNQQVKSSTKEKLPDILRFLLPGLCHLTAEDTARNILLDLSIDNLLFEYLNEHWEGLRYVLGPHGKSEVCEVPESQITSSTEAMVTICNIMMNIVVQEAERVQEDCFYYTLLKFIFTKVPDIPNEEHYLALCGNLCTLGLMILRHQHQNVKGSDFTIFRFVQSTVRFLWDAHNVEESQDFATLVVSSLYNPHWDNLRELWYLGMMTLSNILPTIPWLCDFLIESEWPQTIIKTWVIVREGGIEPSLKTAYEDFLCHLALSSKPALTTLRESGAEMVCRNHQLHDLLSVISV